MMAIKIKTAVKHRVIAAVYIPNAQGFALCEKVMASPDPYRWFTAFFDAAGKVTQCDIGLTEKAAYGQMNDMLRLSDERFTNQCEEMALGPVTEGGR